MYSTIYLSNNTNQAGSATSQILMEALVKSLEDRSDIEGDIWTLPNPMKICRSYNIYV
jgi:hypothetical protein